MFLRRPFCFTLLSHNIIALHISSNSQPVIGYRLLQNCYGQKFSDSQIGNPWSYKYLMCLLSNIGSLAGRVSVATNCSIGIIKPRIHLINSGYLLGESEQWAAFHISLPRGLLLWLISGWPAVQSLSAISLLRLIVAKQASTRALLRAGSQDSTQLLSLTEIFVIKSFSANHLY